MDLHEKFSDIVAIVWNQIEMGHEQNNLLQDDEIKTILCIVRFLENNRICRDKIQFDNVSVIIEQIMILLYEKHSRNYDKEKLQHYVRDATYLLKDEWLFRNLEKNRKCCVVL